MTNLPQVFIGVDISKDHLDIHVHPLAKGFRIENSPIQIKRFIRKLAQFQVEQIVFESSGGYESLLNKLLRKASYKTWIVDPKRIRSFRFSEGIRVKTDATDAKIIAMFASAKERPYAEIETSEKHSKLKAFVRRKHDLIRMIAAEKKRLKHPQQEFCKPEIKRVIQFLEKEVAKIKVKIEALIKTNQSWQSKLQIIQSVPGVGATTSAALLAYMPELGHIEGKQAASLLGVAPYNNESGKFVGKAFIRDGRPLPRKALYMAALTASRSNSKLAEFYQRLIKAGKKPKVALVAVMRKLIVIINAMLWRSQLWKIS